MKNIFKHVAMVAMSIALVGLTACEDPEPEPENPTTASTTYAFHYQGNALEQGQTVAYHPTLTETANDWATVHILMENKTSSNQETYMKVELSDGPDAFNALSICFGSTCKTGTCPWTYGPLSLVPGVNSELEVMIDYMPSIATTPGVYKITIGKGEKMEDPQVMYLNMSN